MATYGRTLTYAREALTEMAEALNNAGRLDDLGKAILDEEAFGSLVDQFSLGKPYPSWDEVGKSDAYVKLMLRWTRETIDFVCNCSDDFEDDFIHRRVKTLIQSQRLRETLRDNHVIDPAITETSEGVDYDSLLIVTDEDIEQYLNTLSEDDRNNLREEAELAFKEDRQWLGPTWDRRLERIYQTI